jgi:hypothetical protein
MKRLFVLLLALPLLMGGRSLMRQQIVSVDLSAANRVPYTEVATLNMKGGQADYLMFRVEVASAAGATNGFVFQAVPMWDRSTPITPPINMVAANGSAAIDSIKTTTDIDVMYAVFWGEILIDVPEGIYPPYLSIQIREDMTAGTANIYAYMVGR